MFKFRMKMLPIQFSNYFMKTCQVYQKYIRASIINKFYPSFENVKNSAIYKISSFYY